MTSFIYCKYKPIVYILHHFFSNSSAWQFRKLHQANMTIAVLPTSDASHKAGTAVQDIAGGNATTLVVSKQERISMAMVIGVSFCVITIVALLVIVAVGYARFIISSGVFLHTIFNALSISRRNFSYVLENMQQSSSAWANTVCVWHNCKIVASTILQKIKWHCTHCIEISCWLSIKHYTGRRTVMAVT